MHDSDNPHGLTRASCRLSSLMSVAMWKSLIRNIHTHSARVRLIAPRELQKGHRRTTRARASLRLPAKVLIQISEPHICLWVVRLSSRRPIPRTFPRRIAQIIPPSPTTHTHRASRVRPLPPLALKSPLSYYVVLYTDFPQTTTVPR